MSADKPYSMAEFDEYVYRTYPQLLSWYDSINCTRHYAGLFLPPGWHGLVLKLLEDVQTLVRDFGEDAPCFRDFKDKRGYLSIHYDGGSDAIDDLVEQCEQQSLAICFRCGALSPRGGSCELCTRRRRKRHQR